MRNAHNPPDSGTPSITGGSAPSSSLRLSPSEESILHRQLHAAGGSAINSPIHSPALGHAAGSAASLSHAHKQMPRSEAPPINLVVRGNPPPNVKLGEADDVGRSMSGGHTPTPMPRQLPSTPLIKSHAYSTFGGKDESSMVKTGPSSTSSTTSSKRFCALILARASQQKVDWV